MSIALLPDLVPLAILFHENSKIEPSTMAQLAETVGEFTADPDQVRRSVTGAKTYPTRDRVDLSRYVVRSSDLSLDEALASRRSVRNFDARGVPLATIGHLLLSAYGVTGRIGLEESAGLVQPLRAAPSGGGLYPVELYLAAFDVSGLEAGVYHFHPLDRCLEAVVRGHVRDAIMSCLLPVPQTLGTTPAVLVLSARWERTLQKYGERGYRIVLLDAGHVAENLLLVATSLGLGACPVAGFLDDPLAEALRLNPADEPVLYVIPFGFAAD